jgi:hypothetical protein
MGRRRGLVDFLLLIGSFNSCYPAAAAAPAFQPAPQPPTIPRCWLHWPSPSALNDCRRHRRGSSRATMAMEGVEPPSPEAAAAEDFLGRLQGAVEAQTFVRLTLTNRPAKAAAAAGGGGPEQPPPVDKLLARLIEGDRMTIDYTHPTSTTTQTLSLEEAPAALSLSLQAALASSRLKASRLFTTEGDWILEQSKGGLLRLYRNKATFTSVEVGSHDRTKKRRLAMPGLLEEGERGEEGAKGGRGFLEAYGILDSRGQPKKGMRDKHRQIERFVEILEAQLRHWDDDDDNDGGDDGGDGEPRRRRGRRLRLLDAGCGRGLLTFAAYEFLTRRVRV